MASLNRRPRLPPQGGTAPRVFEPSNTLRTHEGAPAAQISPELALRRSVCSCLLFEDEFYEDGKAIADRIVELVAQCPARVVADLARDARSHFNLRHVPLLLCAALAAPGRGGSRLIGDTIADVIQRADELSEFVAIYAQVYGVAPTAVKKRMSAQVKKGLAKAFGKFDRYQLAKYFSGSGEKGSAVRGRDVLFLTHPKPADDAQADLFRRIAAKEPVVGGGADTWEVALSAGGDKRETFERLLRERKLGYLALLRNLRNMAEAGVDQALVHHALIARHGARRVLPYRYVAAARACPQYAPIIDEALRAAIADMPQLPGKTVVLVDVSGSMAAPLSSRTRPTREGRATLPPLTRMDAAATLASIIPAENLQVFTFSNHLAPVPPLRGLAGIESILRSQPHHGTCLRLAIETLMGFHTQAFSPFAGGWHAPAVQVGLGVEMDRLIVVTDEQTADHVIVPNCPLAYMINVGSARNGVGYGEHWCHLDGFSEQVLRWIAEYEGLATR